MSNERCGNCKFYHLADETTSSLEDDLPLHEDDFESSCRRYPPVRGDPAYWGHIESPDVLQTFFSGPIVSAIGWCGEWRAQEKAA